jgi:hypothetical protein
MRMKDHLNNNEECDVSKGEIRLPKSSGKVSSLAACKQSCKDVAACQSITLFADGQCQHFSTKCENRKSHDGAIAMRLKEHTANNKECDQSQGEVYMHESSEVTSSFDACMKSCQGVPACNGITFFARGWCSHFSTGCDKTKSTKDAHARKPPRPTHARTHADRTRTQPCSSFNPPADNASKNDIPKALNFNIVHSVVTRQCAHITRTPVLTLTLTLCVCDYSHEGMAGHYYGP